MKRDAILNENGRSHTAGILVCHNINVWNRLPAHVVNSDSVAVLSIDCRV